MKTVDHIDGIYSCRGRDSLQLIQIHIRDKEEEKHKIEKTSKTIIKMIYALRINK